MTTKRADGERIDRPMRAFNPDQPFDLPDLPPDRELESRDVLKLCITARAALAELKQAGELIPNPAILINTIPLLEAQASSAIENIVTTTDRLFRYVDQVDDPTVDPATKEALRYGSALAAGFRSLERRPLCTATATMVCSMIKGVEMDVRRVPGTALANDATGRIVYTPPVGEARLRDLLGGWERFLHDERIDLDPLVKLALMHYQFEAIHPFTDGNGRTGRILNILFLVDQHLLDLPVLYLSRFILRNRADYYALLQAVTERGEWEAWVRFVLQGVEETARWTTGKIRAIRSLLEHAAARVRAAAPAIYSRELVELTFTQPYIRISNVVDAGLAKRQTSSNYLKQLVEIGILRDVKAGRERLFLHTALIRLLTMEDDAVVPYG